jgi:hypothetical protein
MFLVEFSTLPLNKKGIILYPNPVSMIFEFSPGECLHQNVRILIFHRNVLKQHDISLHTISEIMIPNIYMLRSVMKYKINPDFNATLIITINHCQI